MQRSIAVLSLNEICHATVLHLLENFYPSHCRAGATFAVSMSLPYQSSANCKYIGQILTRSTKAGSHRSSTSNLLGRKTQ